MSTKNKIILTATNVALNNILNGRNIKDLNKSELIQAVQCLQVMKLVYNK